VFQDLATGKFINATAITANRWTPALRSAVSTAEAAGEEMLVEIEWAGYPATKTLGTGAYHAEQILLEWAKARGYAILSIAPAAKTACEQYCYDALKIASDIQLQRLGFPIFFY
jgi:hypothetical protein